MPAIINLREIANFLIWDKENKKDEATKSQQKQPQEMLVIGAGCARTGTSSLKAALERLGLKSYHMKYAMTQDTDLWYEHAIDRLQGKPGIFQSKIIPSLAQQGYNATVDNPNCLYYQELMEEYPNAKVILTLRVDDDIDDMDSTVGGESYAASVLSLARFGPLVNRVPYKWFSIVQKISVILEWHMAEHNCPLDPKTYIPKYQDLAASYTKWVKNVRETVPSEKLLLYKPTDGWKPLCDFLTTTTETTTTTFPESSLLQIKTNCQQVLENNESYPYVNDTKAFRNILNVVRWVAVGFENFPIMVVFAILVWWKMKQIKQQKEEAILERRQQLGESAAAAAARRAPNASPYSETTTTTTTTTGGKEKTT